MLHPGPSLLQVKQAEKSHFFYETLSRDNSRAINKQEAELTISHENDSSNLDWLDKLTSNQ